MKLTRGNSSPTWCSTFATTCLGVVQLSFSSLRRVPGPIRSHHRPWPYNPHELALTPGTRLGPYEVLAQIGVGGMGEVTAVQDKWDRALTDARDRGNLAEMLSKSGGSQQHPLDRFGRGRWGGKRLIDPGPEVAIDEEIHA